MMLSTCACTQTSSAEVGSSHTRNSGCVASARAIEMRWRWPPENWCGYFTHVRAGQADRLQQLADPRASARARLSDEAVLAQRLGRRCPRPSSAGSGWRTGPGRSSACAGAAPALRRDRKAACACPARRSASRRASARTARPAGAPRCSCRSPIRRPAPASCRARSRSSTPSTACSELARLALEHAVEPGRRDVEGLARGRRASTSGAWRSALMRIGAAWRRRAASRRRASRRRRAGPAARRGSARTRAGSAG